LCLSLLFLFSIVICLSAASATVSAQTTSTTILGTMTDSSGAVIAGYGGQSLPDAVHFDHRAWNDHQHHRADAADAVRIEAAVLKSAKLWSAAGLTPLSQLFSAPYSN